MNQLLNAAWHGELTSKQNGFFGLRRGAERAGILTVAGTEKRSE